MLFERCSCHIMEPGKGKGSTQTRGGGRLTEVQAGPALELAGTCDRSSTCQWREVWDLEQDFGQ